MAKRNPADATLRNVRSSNTKHATLVAAVKDLKDRVKKLEAFNKGYGCGKR